MSKSKTAFNKPFKVADVLVVVLTADLDYLAQQFVPEKQMVMKIDITAVHYSTNL